MNQYKNSQALLPQLNQFLTTSAQTMQHPLYKAFQCQSGYPVSSPNQGYLNEANTMNLGNYSSFETLAEPTKRIRHNQQSFTKCASKLQKISPSKQPLEQAKLPQDFADLTIKDSLHIKSFDGSQQENSSPLFGEDLIIPGLCNFTQGAFQNASYQAYQRMLQQLQQQKAQYYLQQQFMMNLAKQRSASLNFDQSQVGPKVTQLYETVKFESDAHKVKSENLSESHEHSKTNSTAYAYDAKGESSEDENNFQYITTENQNDNGWESLEEIKRTKTPEKTETKPKVSLKKKTQESKRNNNDNYWTEYSKILGNNIYKKTKEEPRHQNKWQSIKGDEASAAPEIKSPEIEKPVEKTQIQKQPKAPKPVEIPQHMQDDSMIDYENLMSLTITKDPAYVSSEDSTTFVMINKNTHPLIVQPHETRVGDRYQVSVPAYKGRVAGKRRNPKPIWKSEIVKESELKAYFDELCKIFSCDTINQEQALRLLKSKKYRKERVVVNIGKSRKYYATVLMAPSENNEGIANNNA